MNWATAQDRHGTTLRPGSRWHLASLSSPWAPGERRGSQVLQGLGSVASSDSLEAACSEPSIVISQQWPVLWGPQDGSLELPTSTCSAWASAKAPLLPGSQDGPEQERS